MRNIAALLLFATSFAFAQYKAEPAGAPPSELAADVQAALQKQGTKIVAGDGVVSCEVWFRQDLPKGTPSTEMGVTLQNIALGGLVGAIRFPGQGADRRGQTVAAGVYTLRYQLHPVDGAHQGVALQRDFLVLSPASLDKDLNATPSFNDLMAMSRKASGTPHPAVLETWKDDPPSPGKFEKVGDTDWVLHGKIGDDVLAVVLVGKFTEH